jgi:hypothetical protein
MDMNNAVYTTDEVCVCYYTRVKIVLIISYLFQYGRPFIIVREQARKTRSHGIEAIKVSLSLKALHKFMLIILQTDTYLGCKDSRQHCPNITRPKRCVLLSLCPNQLPTGVHEKALTRFSFRRMVTSP